jgi:PAS domain S-box-containing protein
MIHFFSALGTDAIFDILKQSSDPTAIYTGEDLHIQFANDAMLKIWNQDESIRGKKLEEVFPELNEKSYLDILRNAWHSGKECEIQNIPLSTELNGNKITLYYDFKYKPVADKAGKIYCILHTASNVTERQQVWELLRNRETELNIANHDLSSLNHDFQTSNEELTAVNKEYIEMNRNLDHANKEIYFLSDQLRKDNSDLLSGKIENESNISELTLQNEELNSKNNQLKHLNDTVSLLNEKLTTSEMSFRDLITQSPVAMMLLKGEDYVVTMVNVAMLELLGKDATIIGKPLFKEFPELRGQKAADMLEDTYKNGIKHSDDASPVIFKKDGQPKQGFFNFSYTPYIENGIITGVIDMAIDVTAHAEAIMHLEENIKEKVELENNLRESEQRLRSILETMAEGVGVIDASGQMVYANPMAQQILGLKETEIKTRTYDDPQWQNLRIDGTPLPSEEHPMSIMMKTQKPLTDHEIAVQPPNGDRIYLSINAAPMFDQNGVLTGGIGTFMDVTERRLIAQSKDDFISIASHELRTPVTALKASLQMLQKRGMNLTEQTKIKLIDQSVESLNKLTALMNDLLDTSRLEHGQLKIDKKPFTISELFKECLANFAQQTDRKITFEGDLYQKIVADSQQIGQVMVNLINNAIKYAPDSDIVIKANMLDDKEIMISVKDNGPGIPKEKLSRLFERYYRTDYQGQKFSGLGLGLFICADIIKNHSGSIGVESEVGHGSTFWFTLPV